MNTNLSRIQKDIESIGQFTATPGQGTTRFTYTKEYDDARGYIKNEMKAAGLSVFEDAIGNIFGRKEGTEDLPVLIVGSHFDSVRNGGSFDGPAGVVMGLEIARTMYENNIKTRYPIEFVALIEEEGGRFGGGLFASRAIVGSLKPEELRSLKDKDGVAIGEAMCKYGFDPKNIAEVVRKPEDVKAFVELHIEQGPILENENLDIGIVDYIVGLTQIVFTIEGSADHAGTTPMNMRKDALVVAANVASKLPDFAKQAGQETVATIGVFNVSPGAANIVPGKVTFTVDIRSRSEECIIDVRTKIANEIKDSCGDTLSFGIVEKIFIKPIKLSEEFVDLFQQNSDRLGYSYRTMVSGAGHDAMIMAAITPVGLIFVPSKDGKSHSPVEWTDYDKLQKGIEVAYEVVKKIAESI